MIDLSLSNSPSCAIHPRCPFFPIGNLFFQFTSSGIIDSAPEPQHPTEPQQEQEPDAPISNTMVYGPNHVARTMEEAET